MNPLAMMDQTRWGVRPLALALALAAVALGGVRAEVLYETGFEQEDGFTDGDLIGKDGWVADDTGGSGIVMDAAFGPGQQAFIGFAPPDSQRDFLNVWRPIGYRPGADEIIRFSVRMEMVFPEDDNGGRDSFGWSVYNAAEQRLFSIDFRSSDGLISYALDGEGSVFQPTEFAVDVQAGSYRLELEMDFANNRWWAVVEEVLVVDGLAITTVGADPSLGDVDAVWAIASSGSPGNNYMLFDDYRVESVARAAVPPVLEAVERLSDGRFLLRLHGQPDSVYGLDWTGDLRTWNVLRTGLRTDGQGRLDVIDDGAAGQSLRFYRARRE